MLKSLALASLFLSTASFATDYQLPEHVIAQEIQGSGFAPVSAPRSTGVNIYDNGEVMTFSIYRDGRVETKKVATLEADRVNAILDSVKDLGASELVQEDPNVPQCMDAPSTTYIVRNKLGEAVALKGVFGCRDYQRADKAYSNIPAVLQGLRTLAYIHF